MQEYGADLLFKGAKVWSMTLALKEAAEWVVTLHKANASELSNFNQSVGALWKRSEDLLADRKARTRIKTITQGRCCRGVRTT